MDGTGQPPVRASVKTPGIVAFAQVSPCGTGATGLSDPADRWMGGSLDIRPDRNAQRVDLVHFDIITVPSASTPRRNGLRPVCKWTRS